jgi:hypothetical protein
MLKEELKLKYVENRKCFFIDNSVFVRVGTGEL